MCLILLPGEGAKVFYFKMETKTHWKKLHDPNFLGSYSLADDAGNFIDKVVKFTSIAKSEVKCEDGKEAEKIVAQVLNDKPMVINATNAKMLTKLFNSAFIEDWLNKPVTLTVKKIKAFGELVDALRVGATLPTPAALPDFNPDNAQWQTMIDAISGGKNSAVNIIKAIQKTYTISDVNAKLLTDATPKSV